MRRMTLAFLLMAVAVSGCVVDGGYGGNPGRGYHGRGYTGAHANGSWGDGGQEQPRYHESR